MEKPMKNILMIVTLTLSLGTASANELCKPFVDAIALGTIAKECVDVVSASSNERQSLQTNVSCKAYRKFKDDIVIGLSLMNAGVQKACLSVNPTYLSKLNETSEYIDLLNPYLRKYGL